MSVLLKISNLKTAFDTEKGEVICVDNVSLSLKQRETLAIVGESGSGKTVTSLSIIRLLGNSGKIIDGEILFDDENLLNFDEKQLRQIRGNKISMIFQEPMTSLNPVLTIGNQLIEVIKLHLNMKNSYAKEYAIKMLNKVGIPGSEKVINEYPHTLSGGMRQRVMIAMSLLCNPKLLIADEPTTALDVTIQAQILNLMKKLKEDMNMSIILITHDLGVVSEMADRVAVMYAGEVVEEADVFTLFDYPKHPYTIGLMNSIPQISKESKKILSSIKGTVPSVYHKVEGCKFNNRCPNVYEKCTKENPPLIKLNENHLVRCWLLDKSTNN